MQLNYIVYAVGNLAPLHRQSILAHLKTCPPPHPTMDVFYCTPLNTNEEFRHVRSGVFLILYDLLIQYVKLVLYFQLIKLLE